MKTLSFRDIMVCEELSHITNEIELLHTDNDKIVEGILNRVGFDTEYAILYVPSRHRDMQGKDAVGFQCVGEITINRNFIDSGISDLGDRLIAASAKDHSLAVELAQLSGSYVNYGKMTEEDADSDKVDLDENQLEPGWREVSKQIKQLQEIRDVIRGNPYNDAGALKTFAEYQ